MSTRPCSHIAKCLVTQVLDSQPSLPTLLWDHFYVFFLIIMVWPVVLTGSHTPRHVFQLKAALFIAQRLCDALLVVKVLTPCMS